MSYDEFSYAESRANPNPTYNQAPPPRRPDDTSRYYGQPQPQPPQLPNQPQQGRAAPGDGDFGYALQRSVSQNLVQRGIAAGIPRQVRGQNPGVPFATDLTYGARHGDGWGGGKRVLEEQQKQRDTPFGTIYTPPPHPNHGYRGKKIVNPGNVDAPFGTVADENRVPLEKFEKKIAPFATTRLHAPPPRKQGKKCVESLPDHNVLDPPASSFRPAKKVREDKRTATPYASEKTVGDRGPPINRGKRTYHTRAEGFVW